MLGNRNIPKNFLSGSIFSERVDSAVRVCCAPSILAFAVSFLVSERPFSETPDHGI
jgi:hypothetical protein